MDTLKERRLQDKKAEVKRLQGLDDSRLDSLYELKFKNVMLQREPAKPKEEVVLDGEELTPAEKAQGKLDLAVERSAKIQYRSTAYKRLLLLCYSVVLNLANL
ncbi:MAG: hypothetical protein ACFCU1_09410 [Sumerlaeia bacterium]